MARKVLRPEGMPPVDGPFGQAVKVDMGSLLFISGQVALDGEGRLVGKGDIATWTRQVLENIKSLVVLR